VTRATDFIPHSHALHVSLAYAVHPAAKTGIIHIHFYSLEILIEQLLEQEKSQSIKKLCDSETIFNKTATGGGIFNIKPFNAIWSQITWQVKTG